MPEDSIEGMRALTLETWNEVAEKFPPQPFCAFTLRPDAYAVIRSLCKRHPLDGPTQLDGMEMWEVRGQEAEILEWRDEKLLHTYLETLGALRTEGDD
jgi:hypothetical protein